MTVAPPTASFDILHPLSLFRQRDGGTLPPVELIEGSAVPAPYQGLLVHKGDMTSRLEAFHSSPLKLRVLHLDRTPEAYRREVLLCTQAAGIPVEYGANEINLAAFEEPLRNEILAGKLPLGGLLNRAGIKYYSEPRAFLRVRPDATLCRLFEIEPVDALYGRSNTLLSSAGVVLARIVEILRP